MRAWARNDRFDSISVEAWLDYWGRWRDHRDRHVIPRGILTEPWFVPDNIAPELVFAPRVEQAAGHLAVAA